MDRATPDRTTAIFDQYRGLLFSIAYRMLGSATDAEDIVQDAFVRWLQAAPTDVQAPKAYLAAIVTRLCIDQLRSAGARHEHYIGPWLPEPIDTSQRPELVETAILAESLQFAFLLMLEQLGPVERAVLLLRDVFEYSYAEIAAIVGTSEANCRQVLHRAHARLHAPRPRYTVSAEHQTRINEQFLRASTRGDMGGLLALLRDDIVFMADTGGNVPGPRNPVSGIDNVGRGTLGGFRTLGAGAETRSQIVNGQPALVGYRDGQAVGVMFFELAGERIGQIYLVLNPAKLCWLVS